MQWRQANLTTTTAMQRKVSGVNRWVALILAIIWSGAGAVGIVLAVLNSLPVLGLLSLFALCYSALWSRVFGRSRLLTSKKLPLPGRTR